LIKAGIVFYGTNINEYNVANSIKSIHAEVNSCMKVKRTFNRKKVNICVYRTNKQGNKLMCSRPCLNCIKESNKILAYKNYQIHRFYWFDEDGHIQFYTRKKVNEIICSNS
jgi:hypothetical protein